MDNSPTRDSTPDEETTRVRLSSPADVLAVVPHMLGFHPAASLVVIGAGGPRERIELGFRYDLPDPPDLAAAAGIAEHAVTVLGQRGVSTAIVVGYGPGRTVTPVVDAFTAAARHRGLRLREVLRVEDGRYWSYLCGNVDCCPPEGVAFDVLSHPAAAAMSAAGLPAYRDRQSRAATLAPLPGETARAMERAAERACDRVTELIAQARRQHRDDPLSLVVEAGRDAVQAALDTYRRGGEITGEDAVAWLAVALAHLAVRDDAWARMDPQHRDAHLRLWTDVVRRVGSLWVPAPAALLAFTAWQCGDGVLANMAIERALRADPAYSMALLLRDVIDAGVPPSAARVPMSPDEVAASYDQQAAGEPSPRGPGAQVGRRRGKGSGPSDGGTGGGAGAGRGGGAGAGPAGRAGAGPADRARRTSRTLPTKRAHGSR